MLYVKNSEVHYYAEPLGEVYHDLYSFATMNRTEKALRADIRFKADILGLTYEIPQSEWNYNLIIDFLGNIRTQPIDNVIDKFREYLDRKTLHYNLVDTPLHLAVDKLTIDEVLALIQDSEFQSLNHTLTSLHCSTWHLYISNPN